MRIESNPNTATRYDGPITVSMFHFGERAIRLVRPSEPDRLLDAPEVMAWNRHDDYMPYWAYLWPGAYLLAEAIAHEPWHAGTLALEIGCGLGLGGLVALGRGLNVRFTDYDEAPLRFVARSAEENGFCPATFSTARLDWRDLPDERSPVILGADVLYERRLIPLVANLLAHLLEPRGLALIAGPYRVATAGFDDALRSHGLASTCEELTARGEHGPVRGTLHRIRHEEERHRRAVTFRNSKSFLEGEGTTLGKIDLDMEY
jgi:predicted nicotinamide N-methyase